MTSHHNLGHLAVNSDDISRFPYQMLQSTHLFSIVTHSGDLSKDGSRIIIF
jgi:hypothetical protein